MDPRKVVEALKRVSVFGEDLLRSGELDEVVYLSLVDLLVRGELVYNLEEDTFVLRDQKISPATR